jgi:hypothetical protein
MARPPKDPDQRKSVDLRIPVTATQKQIVADAMAIDSREFASWARDLILENALAILAKRPRKRG